MCLTGTGTVVDLRAAHDYFEAAAKLGNADAMYGLGRLYLRDDFYGRDIQKAVPWLASAAKNEHEYAQYTLGRLFLKGEEIPKNAPHALRLLTQAAEQGNQWAQYQLGKMLLYGQEMARDTVRALALLDASAKQGNVYAAKVRDGYFRPQSKTSPNIALGSWRLLGRLSQILQSDIDGETRPDGSAGLTETKLRREIAEKKHGLES